MLIIMAGLPGTGKSAIARQLARDLPAVVLDKDAIRAALFPPAYIDYSTPQDDWCMTIMLQVAAYVWQKTPQACVILDGRTFSRSYQVQTVRQFAGQHGVPLHILECMCPEETARQRLEHDANAARHPAGNRDVTLYHTIKARFEPIPEPKLIVNTDTSFEECIAACLAYLSPKLHGTVMDAAMHTDTNRPNKNRG
ncbi:MAG: ATP-binding protein [Chloroflexota bacterium]|nr:ATP-binding protein [Chloroflexota bacterium]